MEERILYKNLLLYVDQYGGLPKVSEKARVRSTGESPYVALVGILHGQHSKSVVYHNIICNYSICCGTIYNIYWSES